MLRNSSPDQIDAAPDDGFRKVLQICQSIHEFYQSFYKLLSRALLHFGIKKMLKYI